MIKAEVRAMLAATALAHSLKRHVRSIYDYSESRHRNISIDVTGDNISGYDYGMGAHFSGTIPRLYHYGISGHIDCNMHGTGSYKGYDYSSGSHFEIQLRGNSVSFYDFGGSGWTNYSL